MIDIRRSAERGQADHGWLRSQHTFSFAGYRDPRFMGFGHLRVINEDRVAGGAGFPTHPHRDMEILSYVISGALEHRDTLGTGSVIRPGEVQLMSAGRGIAHSEYNHSADEEVHFLQIWLLPRSVGGAPRYQQRDFGDRPGLTLVCSPDGRDGALEIQQDADVHRALLTGDTPVVHRIARRRAWIQVVAGTVMANGARLGPGDGLALTELPAVSLRALDGAAEALVFDLA